MPSVVGFWREAFGMWSFRIFTAFMGLAFAAGALVAATEAPWAAWLVGGIVFVVFMTLGVMAYQREERDG